MLKSLIKSFGGIFELKKSTKQDENLLKDLLLKIFPSSPKIVAIVLIVIRMLLYGSSGVGLWELFSNLF